MDAYVHVRKVNQKVAVGVVIREGYETLSSAGWLHSDDDMWQALRDAVAGLCATGEVHTIHTSLQSAVMAVHGRHTHARLWAETRVALHQARARLVWTPDGADTGMATAAEKSGLMLGHERRGVLSWRRNGRCR